MKLSIIIVNWNTERLLSQCLQSIFANPPRCAFEIWVVDNSSTDQSLGMLRANFPTVQVIRNPANLGFARANNRGMRKARGDYFLLLNSDTVLLPKALDGLLRAADENPGAGIVGCKLLNPEGSIQESWARFPNLVSEILGRNVRERRPLTNQPGLYEVDWVGGACLLVRKEAADQVGLLDETFFMYSEEVDWCYRMKAAGWKTLYLESAAIIHFGGGSASRSSFKQQASLYGSKLRFFEKHYGRWPARLLRAGLILTGLGKIAWRWMEIHLRRQPAHEQQSRLQSQWQLIRRLWAGNIS